MPHLHHSCWEDWTIPIDQDEMKARLLNTLEKKRSACALRASEFEKTFNFMIKYFPGLDAMSLIVSYVLLWKALNHYMNVISDREIEMILSLSVIKKLWSHIVSLSYCPEHWTQTVFLTNAEPKWLWLLCSRFECSMPNHINEYIFSPTDFYF